MIKEATLSDVIYLMIEHIFTRILDLHQQGIKSRKHVLDYMNMLGQMVSVCKCNLLPFEKFIGMNYRSLSKLSRTYRYIGGCSFQDHTFTNSKHKLTLDYTNVDGLEISSIGLLLYQNLRNLVKECKEFNLRRVQLLPNAVLHGSSVSNKGDIYKYSMGNLVEIVHKSPKGKMVSKKIYQDPRGHFVSNNSFHTLYEEHTKNGLLIKSMKSPTKKIVEVFEIVYGLLLEIRKYMKIGSKYFLHRLIVNDYIFSDDQIVSYVGYKVIQFFDTNKIDFSNVRDSRKLTPSSDSKYTRIEYSYIAIGERTVLNRVVHFRNQEIVKAITSDVVGSDVVGSDHIIMRRTFKKFKDGKLKYVYHREVLY